MRSRLAALASKVISEAEDRRRVALVPVREERFHAREPRRGWEWEEEPMSTKLADRCAGFVSVVVFISDLIL